MHTPTHALARGGFGCTEDRYSQHSCRCRWCRTRRAGSTPPASAWAGWGSGGSGWTLGLSASGCGSGPSQSTAAGWWLTRSQRCWRTSGLEVGEGEGKTRNDLNHAMQLKVTVIETQQPESEHASTPSCGWTQTKVSWAPWDTVQRWFTTALAKTVTPGTRRHSRRGQERGMKKESDNSSGWKRFVEVFYLLGSNQRWLWDKPGFQWVISDVVAQ